MAGDRLFNLFDWSQVLEANYRTRDYWCDLVDGAFSWESAWPEREGYGGKIAGDVSPDFLTAAAAHNHSKLYMVPLSPIQYKNSYKTNVYRPGQHALPKRMELILDTVKQADFVQFLTWNDGPESLHC
ncbi:uncharacterized protein BDZ83DRAFT_20069 [Colletotrichum acutatum]|uniref:Uncharacterized protein n=1 Tax=Glomerella acutata TaxID=27357 RepID=A0AAD8UGM1_GLOAC|nr:uncharacterized protein BDZ83DRAFT_20069 [Colletotrichum acutatum]KAK1718176.1 hypothetical protein BDZ83DRAFT_20069 [Colletotrichum acutatum]